MKRLDIKGFAHWIIPALIVVAIGGIGVYEVVGSHADSIDTADRTAAKSITINPGEWGAWPSYSKSGIAVTSDGAAGNVLLLKKYVNGISAGYAGIDLGQDAKILNFMKAHPKRAMQVCVRARGVGGASKVELEMVSMTNTNPSQVEKVFTLSAAYSSSCYNFTSATAAVVGLHHDHAIGVFNYSGTFGINVDTVTITLR